jgi:hypothetical protein
MSAQRVIVVALDFSDEMESLADVVTDVVARAFGDLDAHGATIRTRRADPALLNILANDLLKADP